MTPLAAERAPAKVNLSLFLGPPRADGRHELVTLFDSVTLFDELEVAAATRDEVVCEDVPGPNLVSAALSALRDAGWDAPPVRVRIHKRIPVAAGMGGGSADAAAMLRLAPRLGSVAPGAAAAIAGRLGSDVPGQLVPGPSLGTGAGDIVEPLAALAPYGVVVIPQPFPLSTADVYRRADELGCARTSPQLAAVRARLARALPGELPPDLVVNDLQAPARSLAPEIDDALRAVSDAGADHALVCGSGPTVIGLFLGAGGAARATAAADELRPHHARVEVAEPVGAGLAGSASNE